MQTDTLRRLPLPEILHGTMASTAEIVDDGAICFQNDRLKRSCERCRTVFSGSALRLVVRRWPEPCPFCGHGDTRTVM